MADAQTTIAELQDAVRAFAAERSWEPFHSPKNLAMALAVEVAELMEPFLWVTPEESRSMGDDPAWRPALADELADVFILLINMSLSLRMDMSEAVRVKLIKNAEIYPASMAGR